MRKAAVAVACLFALTALGGCDVMNYIWQRIVGVSFAAVDFAAIQGDESNMRASNITSLFSSSVVVYKTTNGLLGKMGVLGTGTGLTIELTTYDASGNVVASSTSLTIHDAAYCDLETATEVFALGSTVDFQWASSILMPQGNAVFYVLP